MAVAGSTPSFCASARTLRSTNSRGFSNTGRISSCRLRLSPFTLAEKSLVAPIGWPFLWFAMVAGSMARVRAFVKKDNGRCIEEGVSLDVMQQMLHHDGCEMKRARNNLTEDPQSPIFSA